MKNKLLLIVLLFSILTFSQESEKERLRGLTSDNIIGTGFTYPTPVEIDGFDWGDFNASTLNPITEGTTTTDAVSGAELIMVADDNDAEFTGVYPKHQLFNANDTLLKFKTSSGLTIVPVETAGDPNTYTQFSVESGGYWSPQDPDLIYSLWNYTGTDVALKSQIYPTQTYGNEVLLHDFTSTHDNINMGMNEGNIDYNDKYVAITAQKSAGYSGQEYEAIILDLDDCKANPNQASNIHSRMDLADGGQSIIDWVSMSPSGDYFVIAYFGEFTINPLTGNAIIVYDNTATTPTIKTYTKLNSNSVAITGVAYFNESHADMALDVAGDDVWVGFKSGTDPSAPDADGATYVGGVMGYDNDTFMAMARLSDGQVDYIYRDTVDAGYSTRGIYGGYVSGRNTKRQGWIYVTEDCCMNIDGSSDGRNSGDLIALKLDRTGDNLMEYYGRSYVERQWSQLNYPTVSTSPQMVVSNNGHMMSFDSWFSNDDLLTLHPVPASHQGPSWLLKYPQPYLAIETLEKSNNIYPNPTNGILKINNNGIVLSIHDMLGRKLAFNQSLNSISISNFSSGIYSVSVSLNNTIETFKILKN